jgi:hypothetical protein
MYVLYTLLTEGGRREEAVGSGRYTYKAIHIKGQCSSVGIRCVPLVHNTQRAKAERSGGTNNKGQRQRIIMQYRRAKGKDAKHSEDYVNILVNEI